MRVAALTLVALASVASVADAAAPGCNLTWSNCSTLAASGNWTFACDDNTVSKELIVSYRLASNLPDFVGVSVTLDILISAPDSPNFWQIGSGGCREGAIHPDPVGAFAGCTNAYEGGGQAGGYVLERYGRACWRYRADWARDAIAAQTANTLYAAQVIRMTTNRAYDDGSGVCDGCDVGVCFVLQQVEVYGYNTGLAASLSNPDFRSWATYQGGVSGTGCPDYCTTPARTSTWGAVKAVYR